MFQTVPIDRMNKLAMIGIPSINYKAHGISEDGDGYYRTKELRNSCW